MPYIVQKTVDIYDADDDSSHEEEIESWLNEREEHGYQLVGILPDHRAWDADGKPTGPIGCMFILHHPVEAQLMSIDTGHGAASSPP